MNESPINFRTAQPVTGSSCVQRRVIRCSLFLPLFWFVLWNGGCAPRPAPATPPASTNLHLAAVLYGKYVSAHDGQMPADQKELVKYADANEGDILQRHQLDSAAEIFAESKGQRRIVMLYRDQREHLQTSLVALEEQTPGEQKQGGKNQSKWFAADILGVPHEINAKEAERLLTEGIQAEAEATNAHEDKAEGADQTEQRDDQPSTSNTDSGTDRAAKRRE